MSMDILEIERARRLEAAAKILHCQENGDGGDDTPCKGSVRLYRTEIGVRALCGAHSTKAYEEKITDEMLLALGIEAKSCGPTVVLRIPLAEQWDLHEVKAVRLYRLGVVSRACLATPCEPCSGESRHGCCVCPCHSGAVQS